MTGGAPLQPGARFPAAGASESLGRWRDQSQPQSLFRLNIFRGSNPRDIMSLKDRISEDMKSAMRARESDRLSALRLLLAAIKQREVDERITLDDAQIAAVVEKLAKQRRDSITQFEAGGRQDLADREKFELTVLLAYLPEQADASQIAAAVESAIAATGAAGPQDMGKVMAQVRSVLAGRADMAAVSAQVKARLAR